MATNVNNTTTLLQAMIDDALANYYTVDLGEKVWTINKALTLNAILGQGGFGIKNGTIVQNASNVPIIEFTGGSYQSISLRDLNLEFSSPQPSTNTNAVGILLNMGSQGASIYNSALDRIQITNAYRSLAQANTAPGAWWGNRTTNFQSKNNSGAAIYLATNSNVNAPNNYFGNIYSIPASISDLWQFMFEYTSNLTLENVETNNAQGGLIWTANCRNVNMRNVRWEMGINAPLQSNMVNHGIIECNGDAVKIIGYEVQWDQTNPSQIDTGGDLFLFKDGAGPGFPPNAISNVVLYQPTLGPNSSLYGAASQNTPTQLQTVAQWYVTAGNYMGDALPGSQVTSTQYP